MSLPNPATLAVLAIWLKTGKPVTRQEIAECIGCTVQALRKHFEHGAPPCCTHETITRPVMSRDYPMLQRSTRQIDAWVPTRAFLREQLQILLGDKS